MLESKCDLKMYLRNLAYPLPLQTGGLKTTIFDYFTIMTILTAYIFGMKHDIHNRVSELEAIRGLSSQNVTNFGPQTF